MMVAHGDVMFSKKTATCQQNSGSRDKNSKYSV